MKIACIGSSTATTPELEEALEDIGEFVVSQDWWLASGNAKGADAAYARGGNRVNPKRVLLYTVDRKHNPQFLVKGNVVAQLDQLDPAMVKEWEFYARHHHDRYPLLKPYVQKLMIRNAGIVRNADAVIAFLNRSKIGFGGTGHGWRIAATLGIARLDISIPRNLASVKEFLTNLSTRNRA